MAESRQLPRKRRFQRHQSQDGRIPLDIRPSGPAIEDPSPRSTTSWSSAYIAPRPRHVAFAALSRPSGAPIIVAQPDARRIGDLPLGNEAQQQPYSPFPDRGHTDRRRGTAPHLFPIRSALAGGCSASIAFAPDFRGDIATLDNPISSPSPCSPPTPTQYQAGSWMQEANGAWQVMGRRSGSCPRGTFPDRSSSSLAVSL